AEHGEGAAEAVLAGEAVDGLNILQPTKHVAGSLRAVIIELRHEGDTGFVSETHRGERFHWHRVMVQHLQDSGFNPYPI
ncbi:MAG: hypothetical protein WAM20_14535, partial [Acidobacteriaceae bacterium]